MARAEEKHGFMSAYSPVRENEQEGHDANDVDEAVSGSGCGCGCFRLCCFGWGRSNQESKYLLQQHGENREEDSWFVNKLKQLKEFSELVAGPKWKNLIRKIGKYCNPKKSRTQYKYTPQSYALNFDDGEEEDDLFVSFSSRFSGPLSTDQQRRGTS